MSDERKIEIMYGLLDYLCSVDTAQCVAVLQTIGVTRSEAMELEFFDNVYDQLPEYYQ